MAGLYDLIPGLREAEDRYRADSYEAFAGLEPPICGKIDILPLTPQMFLELDGCENGVFKKKGAIVAAEDLMIFLWRTSPKYCRDPELRGIFLTTLVDLDYEKAVEDVHAYLTRTWKGIPLWKSTLGGGGPNLAQWPSRLVHMFASNYGWTEEKILNTPFRRLWQYANRIMESADKDFKEASSEALQIRGDYLRALNEKTQAAINGGQN